jgi:hypothetical protein
MMKTIKQVIARLLIAVMAVNHVAVGIAIGKQSGYLLSGLLFYQYTYADAIDDLIAIGDQESLLQAGEDAGNALLGTAPLPESDGAGGFNLNMGATTQTITPEGLYGPESSGYDFNGNGDYGDDSGLGTSVTGLQTELETSTTVDGEAYRTVNEILLTAPIDLVNDPIWTQGETAIADVEANPSDSEFYAECTTETFTIDRSETITEYSEETCRDMKETSGSCRVTRIPIRTAVGLFGEGRIGQCGDGCNQFQIKHVPQINLDPTECANNPSLRKQILFRAGLLPDGENFNIASATIESITAASAITITANGALLYSNTFPATGCGSPSVSGPIDITAQMQSVMIQNRTVDFIIEVNAGDSPEVLMNIQYDGDWWGSDQLIQLPLNCLIETGFPDEVLEETGFCRADSWTCNSEDNIDPVNIVERGLNTIPISVWVSSRDNNGDNRHCEVTVRNDYTGQQDAFFMPFGNNMNPLGWTSVQSARCSILFNTFVDNPLPASSTEWGGAFNDYTTRLNNIGISTEKWIGLGNLISSPIDLRLGDCSEWCFSPVSRIFNIDPNYDVNYIVVPWEHKRLFPGDDNAPVCLEADANNYVCNPFGSDPICLGQGDEQQCGTYDELFNDGDDCQVYKDDPNCGILSSNPDPDFIDPATGESYSFTSVYQCGVEYTIPGEDIVEEENCVASINCLSGDCITRADEINSDFGEATGQLSVANFIKQENSCAGQDSGTATDCKIFDGNDSTCRQGSALGVDCCEDPTGASTLSYISGAYQMMNTANDHGALDFLQPAVDSTYETMTGAWDQVVDSSTDVWDVIADGFSSTYDNMIGTTASEVTTSVASNAGTDISGQLITDVSSSTTDLTSAGIGETIGAFKNQVMETAYNGLNTIYEGLGDVFIEKATENVGGDIVSTFGVSTLLSSIMFIYMIYNLANLAISLIYACEDEEFLMATQKAQGMCYLTGKTCAEEWLGSCVIDEYEYCCFDSPVARIIQEQAKTQFAMADDDCSGFSMDQLQGIDWSQIDFSEWIDLLTLAGTIPTTRTVDMDSLSAGGALDGGDRQSVTGRTQDRLDNLDTEAVRNQLSDNLR